MPDQTDPIASTNQFPHSMRVLDMTRDHSRRFRKDGLVIGSCRVWAGD